MAFSAIHWCVVAFGLAVPFVTQLQASERPPAPFSLHESGAHRVADGHLELRRQLRMIGDLGRLPVTSMGADTSWVVGQVSTPPVEWGVLSNKQFAEDGRPFDNGRKQLVHRVSVSSLDVLDAAGMCSPKREYIVSFDPQTFPPAETPDRISDRLYAALEQPGSIAVGILNPWAAGDSRFQPFVLIDNRWAASLRPAVEYCVRNRRLFEVPSHAENVAVLYDLAERDPNVFVRFSAFRALMKSPQLDARRTVAAIRAAEPLLRSAIIYRLISDSPAEELAARTGIVMSLIDRDATFAANIDVARSALLAIETVRWPDGVAVAEELIALAGRKPEARRAEETACLDRLAADVAAIRARSTQKESGSATRPAMPNPVPKTQRERSGG